MISLDRTWQEFISGAVQSCLLILAAEIGDKSFLLTAVFAKKMNVALVFLVTLAVHLSIHVLSVWLGFAFGLFLPKMVTEVIQIATFFLMSLHACWQVLSSTYRRRARKKQGLKESSDSEEDNSMQ